jgi:hypothetical protein
MTLEAQGSQKSIPRFTMRNIFMGQGFVQQQAGEIKDSSDYIRYRKLVAIQKKSFPNK